MYVEVNMEGLTTATEFIRLNEILQGREDILKSLFINYIDTVEDLLKYNVEELLNIENISLFTIAVLKKSLNELGYHLKGEEIVDYADYFDSERVEPLKCCDVIIKNKRKLQKKIIYIDKEIFTT